MCIILLCLKLSVIIILFKCQSINLNIFIYHNISSCYITNKNQFFVSI